MKNKSKRFISKYPEKNKLSRAYSSPWIQACIQACDRMCTRVIEDGDLMAVFSNIYSAA